MESDQIAAVERVREKAARKGVDLGLSDLQHYGGSDWEWCYENIDSDAAALIVTGALAKWLAGQGIAVCQMWNGGGVSWFMYRDGGHGWSALSATDHLSALLAATLARLDELPDAAAESQPASKEPPQ